MRFTGDDPDLGHVLACELQLQDPVVRRSPGVAAALLDPEFREFGASGRIWDAGSVLEMMATHDAPPPVTDDVVATRLAPDVVLLTYRARRVDRANLRSSIWRRRDGGPWRLLFHQGTASYAGPA